MTKRLIITLSLFFIFGQFITGAEPTVQGGMFDTSVLSKRGQAAYGKLLSAASFDDSHIGFAGSLSGYIVDFGVLLEEKNADAAFKSILKNGTNAGKLYALSGLYFTDYHHFRAAVERQKKNKNTVMKLSGCIASDEKVSDIVESNAKNVAIIKRTQTIEDFWKNNKGSYVLDIANGGYPAAFRHYAKNVK